MLWKFSIFPESFSRAPRLGRLGALECFSRFFLTCEFFIFRFGLFSTSFRPLLFPTLSIEPVFAGLRIRERVREISDRDVT